MSRAQADRDRTPRGLWPVVAAVLVGATCPAMADDRPARREPIGPYLNRAFPDAPPAPTGGWAAVPAFPRLTFEDPMFLLPAPRGDLLYVGGRQGLIWSFVNDPNATTKTTFLDLRARCQGWDDGGLLALAFHPRFGQAGAPGRGHVYVWYTYTPAPTPGPDRPPTDRPTRDRLSRFSVPDGADAADPNSELVLIDQLDENMWHNGGGLFFHPEDGFLYLSLGDEGGDYGNTQRIDKDLFSGVIRIDVDCRGVGVSHPPRRQPRTGRTANYFIPDDNPWVGLPDALEEFWCVGLRSPHRMTYDPVGRRIWLGDVGEGSREEVDIVERGGNYQWRFREGTIGGPDGRPARLLGVEKPPIHEYTHQDGTAVIGGYVYRGREHARSIGGKYVFGDNGGRVWALSYEGSGPARVEPLCDLPVIGSRAYGVGLSSFGVDRDGELYLCQLGTKGQIHRLARTGTADAGLPRLLSETRTFRDLATLDPAPGLVPYEVNSPLWSDGAAKRRWVAVPNDGPPYGPGERIGFAAVGAWSFPAGTVFVKHFELAGRRLETRFLIRSAGVGAYGLTYRWRPDGSDADLIDDPADEPIRVRTASGERTQTWHYPGRRECLLCHNAPAGYVLGASTRQLNDHPAGDRLESWGRLGLLDPPPAAADLPKLPRSAGLGDESASLEHRVRSYLDSNCASCHRPGGVRARLDARLEAGPSGLLDAEVANLLGVPGARVIVAGDPDRSIAARRMASTAPMTRMPPLATSVVDARATAALRDWIAGLPAGPAVRLARPSGGAVVESGTPIAIEAEVGGRAIRSVEFYRGADRLGSAGSAPFRLDWAGAEPGSYALSARAVDDRGRAGHSDPVTVTVVPPRPREQGGVYLSDLRWASARSGYGPVERDRSNGEREAGDGREISLGGKTYPKGLGVHSSSRIEYRLAGRYATFLADVGVDDEAGESGSVTFEVWADGAKLFDSGLLRGGMPPREVRLDLAGRSTLTLVVTDGDDGDGSDHADWAAARLIPRVPNR